MRFLFITVLTVFGLCFFGAQNEASAQFGAQGASKEVKQLASAVARMCLGGNWETQTCLRVISESTLMLAARYAGDLQHAGKGGAVEKIKQHCAAATAATQQEVPAYAMQSALTECANMIYDVSEETGVKPDQSHYQLLVGPVLCLSGDRRCPAVEQGLKKYGR